MLFLLYLGMRKQLIIPLILAFWTLKAQVPAIFSIPDSLKTNANAIVREYDTHVKLSEFNQMETHYHKVITVFNKEGYYYAQPIAHYDKSTKIEDFKVQIYNKNGALISAAKPKDIRDESAVSDGALYTDDRIMGYPYTPTEYPYTIVFDYNEKTKNTLFHDWYLIDNGNISIENASHTIENPTQQKINWSNAFVHDAVIEQNISPTEMRFVLKKPLKAIVEQDFTPSAKYFLPRIQLALEHFQHEGTTGYLKNWETFGSWIADLVAQTADLPEETKIKAKGLTQGLSKKESVKKLYEYMQQKTRYVNVSIGIGGLKPANASLVDKLGYGDCKGLTNYMKNLLAAVDIPSYYTVVHAGSKIDLDPDFTNFQGNHVILCVPVENDTIWLENTDQKMPFNFLGDFTFDRNVLLVDKTHSKIVRTPNYNENQNSRELNANISFNQNAALINSTILSKGLEYDDINFVKDLDSDKKEILYKNRFSKVKNLQIKSIDFSSDKDEVSFTENLNFESLNIINLSSNLITFSPVMLDEVYDFSQNEKRTVPLVIKEGLTHLSNYTVKIPEGLIVKELPKNISLQSPFGSYDLTFTQNEEGIKVQRKWILKQGDYPKEKATEFQTFLKNCRKADKTVLLIEKL